MKAVFFSLFIITICCGNSISGQTSCKNSDTLVNNLVHLKNYKTTMLGDIPEYKKYGKGEKTLILIPGLGFDASVFDDFVKVNKKNYTMFVITIPGFGKTHAPPMPDSTVSYGDQTWSKGFISGILKLIEKEKIKKPIIVGHFTLGTQLALRIAIDYPEEVSGVIVLGGQSKFIAIQKGKVLDYPLNYMIMGTDKYSAPVMFKGKKEKDWDEGNYLPEIYSLDNKVGKKLWSKVAEVPVPVMVRYLCEYQATDIKAELNKIKCPVLVVRPLFNSTVLSTEINSYVKPQFIDSWDEASKKNPLIQVRDINNSGTFLWKDQPKMAYEVIVTFIKELTK